MLAVVSGQLRKMTKSVSTVLGLGIDCIRPLGGTNAHAEAVQGSGGLAASTSEEKRRASIFGGRSGTCSGEKDTVERCEDPLADLDQPLATLVENAIESCVEVDGCLEDWSRSAQLLVAGAVRDPLATVTGALGGPAHFSLPQGLSPTAQGLMPDDNNRTLGSSTSSISRGGTRRFSGRLSAQSVEGGRAMRRSSSFNAPRRASDADRGAHMQRRASAATDLRTANSTQSNVGARSGSGDNTITLELTDTTGTIVLAPLTVSGGSADGSGEIVKQGDTRVRTATDDSDISARDAASGAAPTNESSILTSPKQEGPTEDIVA